jgi:hypothetical protein
MGWHKTYFFKNLTTLSLLVPVVRSGTTIELVTRRETIVPASVSLAERRGVLHLHAAALVQDGSVADFGVVCAQT